MSCLEVGKKDIKVELLNKITQDFGEFLELNKDDLTSLNNAVESLYVGKRLMKQDEYSSDDDMKNYPLNGYILLRDCTQYPEKTLNIVLQHRERSDGSGYPYGIKDEEISELSKVVAICEEYLNLREGMTKEDTMEGLCSIRSSLNENLLNRFLEFISGNNESLGFDA